MKIKLSYSTSGRQIWLETLFNCQIDDVDSLDERLAEYAADRIVETVCKVRELEETQL